MSYSEFTDGDVYVYATSTGECICQLCKLYPTGVAPISFDDFSTESRLKMIEHLDQHKEAGDEVLDKTIEMLDEEITELGDNFDNQGNEDYPRDLTSDQINILRGMGDSTLRNLKFTDMLEYITVEDSSTRRLMDKNWKKVEENLKKVDIQNEKNKKLSDMIGLQIESPISVTFHEIFDVAIQSMASSVNVEKEDFYWYVYDNEFGRCEIESGVDGGSVMKKIKNVRDFRWLCDLQKAHQKKEHQ